MQGVQNVRIVRNFLFLPKNCTDCTYFFILPKNCTDCTECTDNVSNYTDFQDCSENIIKKLIFAWKFSKKVVKIKFNLLVDCCFNWQSKFILSFPNMFIREYVQEIHGIPHKKNFSVGGIWYGGNKFLCLIFF